jgi:hypothetical protein
VSLYLCVFAGEQEMEGVEVGPYSDYNALRRYIVEEIEGGVAGSRFPAFVLHSDCDGEWSVADCPKLRSELAEISAAMKERPPVAIEETRAQVRPTNAFESFVDVDGQFLLERLQTLVDVALQKGRPILFQ